MPMTVVFIYLRLTAQEHHYDCYSETKQRGHIRTMQQKQTTIDNAQNNKDYKSIVISVHVQTKNFMNITNLLKFIVCHYYCFALVL